MNTFEIHLRGTWLTVDRYVFRSWCGPRRLNGHKYLGPRFLFLTSERIPPTQLVSEDPEN